MSSDLWGTDTPISMPEPLSPDAVIHVDFGGFGFTEGGIAHQLTEADVEAYTMPAFRPFPSVEGGQ